MKQKESPESVVRQIRRKTRKQYSAEEKIRIVLEGLRGEESIAAFCVPNIYEALKFFESNGVTIIKYPFFPKSNDEFQPLISFIEGPDKQEIEIREQRKIRKEFKSDPR